MSFASEFVQALVRALEKPFETSIYGVKIKIAGPLSEETIDDRLAKLETARENLASAIEAVDELQARTRQNKRDLQELNDAIAQAETGKSAINQELETVKNLAALDVAAVRKVLKVPTSAEIWADRFIGFVFGVAASLAATFVWNLI